MNAATKKRVKVISYVPFYISLTPYGPGFYDIRDARKIPSSHPTFFPLRRWKLIPGLWLEKIPKTLQKKIQEVDHPWGPAQMSPNYALWIDNEKYKRELENDFQQEGYKIPESMKDWPEISYRSIDLARLVLISLIPQEKFAFSLGHNYEFIEKSSGSGKTYHQVPRQITPGYLPESCGAAGNSMLPRRKIDKINRKKLTTTIKTLERYYRPYSWKLDRLAVALRNLWAALVSWSEDQVFMHITIIFEALLSTDNYEITHQLAERAAILIGRTSEERVDIYDDFKNFYKIRGDIVHGIGAPQGNKFKRDRTVIVTPRFIAVPKGPELFDLSFRLIEATIRERKMISIIQSKPSGDKITKELREFFKEKLLSM